MTIKKILFGVMSLFLCLSVGPGAFATTRSFTVHFASCAEFVGWGPVPLAKAQPLVPAGCEIAGAAMGQAAIVVRATSCQAVSIGQSPAQPTELSQIGINVVGPDGSGDINNYTVIYVTNNQALAEHFQAAGLLAVFDRQLTYEYTPDSSNASRQLYVTRPVMSCRPIFSSALRPTRRQIPNRASWRMRLHRSATEATTGVPPDAAFPPNSFACRWSLRHRAEMRRCRGSLWRGVITMRRQKVRFRARGSTGNADRLAAHQRRRS